ncbi:MAG TPA: helix-turn-helix domain-containing protein, partial [Burkholderiaceae bacterium]
IEHEHIVTSAGSAAGLDMLLQLVRNDHGPRIANQVAQRLVLAPHRDGGQAQFVPRPLPPGDDGKLARLMAWLRANLEQDHSVESMAQQAAMSERTLQRQFQDSCGQGPHEWLIRERVAYAKELLEATATPLAQVAELAGFGSEETMRRHFRRIVDTSPAQYRRSFAA